MCLYFHFSLSLKFLAKLFKVVEVVYDNQQNFTLVQMNAMVQQEQGLMTTDGFQDYETHRCMHLTDMMKPQEKHWRGMKVFE